MYINNALTLPDTILLGDAYFSVKHQGQPGIISCIAASPQGGGIYAAGSYARAS
jgi:hypothetical protein